MTQATGSAYVHVAYGGVLSEMIMHLINLRLVLDGSVM